MTNSSQHSQSNKTSVTKDAAERLQRALTSLSLSLDPLVKQVGELEKNAVDNQHFETDRARLASDLDAAKAREDAYKARENDVAQLADETAKELESVIAQVLHALEAK